MLGKRNRESFTCSINRSYRNLLLDSSLIEHIRLSHKVAFFIKDFKRSKQEIRVIRTESRVVCTGVYTTIFLTEFVVYLVELILLLFDFIVGVIFGLVFNKGTNTISDFDKSLYSVLGSHRNINGFHTTVLTIINLAVIYRITEVANIGVCRDGVINLIILKVLELIFSYFSVNVLNSFRKHFLKVFILIRNASRFGTKWTTNHFHFAHNHIGIIDEILIHFNAVLIRIQMHPIGICVDNTVTLL